LDCSAQIFAIAVICALIIDKANINIYKSTTFASDRWQMLLNQILKISLRFIYF